MDTKLNPEPNSCFNRALPDEPRFTLLGRDHCAPDTIRRWADLRARLGVEEGSSQDGDQLIEALEAADAMESWRTANDGAWRGQQPVEPDLIPTPSDELSSLAGRVQGRGNPLDSPAFVRSLIEKIAEANSAAEAQAALKELLSGYFDDARRLAGFVMRADRQAGSNR